ncbi:response regulator [Enterococcus faecalis]|nr:response regulator [Enterococcus faecalis]EGO8689567.1 response regulator [Enterococcus faecalis]
MKQVDLNFYIIEDNYFHKKELTKLLRTFGSKESVLHEEVDIYNFEQLISEKKLSEKDVFFFDIDFNDSVTGIDLAEKLRNKNVECQIVFYTANSANSLEIICRNILPIGMLVKGDPQLGEHLQQVLKKIQQTIYQKNGEPLIFQLSGQTIRINKEEIKFVETNKEVRNWVTFKLLTGEKMIHMTMKELKKIMVEKNFYKELRSYIINFNLINEIDKKNETIIFADGQALYLGTKIINKLAKAYTDWSSKI